jgi:hypothetical protein
MVDGLDEVLLPDGQDIADVEVATTAHPHHEETYPAARYAS